MCPSKGHEVFEHQLHMKPTLSRGKRTSSCTQYLARSTFQHADRHLLLLPLVDPSVALGLRGDNPTLASPLSSFSVVLLLVMAVAASS